MENLTIEQEDEILRADMEAIASGTNEQEEETTEETTEVESETSEAETTETAEEEVKPKKKSNIAKLLAEKNEYKNEVIEARKRIEELESRVWDDKETDIEYLDAKMDKKIAERFEIQDFFARNPEAREFKEELDEFRAENPNLSYDRAYKFYLAETNPQALLDEQTRNKLGSNTYSSVWRTPPSLRQSKNEFDYSDAELDNLIKAGKIKL